MNDKLSIIYEDDNIIAVNKPAGMIAQDDSTGRISVSSLVKKYISENTSSADLYLGPVHRLDRPVSGVMLFAKTKSSAGKLSGQFKSGSVMKFYCAAVEFSDAGFPDGWFELRDYMVRRRDRAYISKPDVPGAKEVVLRYHVLQRNSDSTLILIRLITGQRHQIRVQLGSCGMPIVGDYFYGARSHLPGKQICLHSAYLEITHPESGCKLTLSAPIPEHFASLFSNI